MIVKNIFRIASIVMLLAIASPASSNSIVSDSSQTNGPAKTEDTRGAQMLQRLIDIRDMNKSELSRSEKKDLRKEVRAIKKEMKDGNGGIYLSVGAIII